MLESEKLTQIVQAWLGYIRLEELTQALVERSSDIYSKVLDKGVQLVGNKPNSNYCKQKVKFSNS
ncbi:hypothetical protein LC612_38080 [Nostoc sp. CHAB 5834]|nr:hypothetical protein [Nostoc sp. CHAB 5834]